MIIALDGIFYETYERFSGTQVLIGSLGNGLDFQNMSSFSFFNFLEHYQVTFSHKFVWYYYYFEDCSLWLTWHIKPYIHSARIDATVRYRTSLFDSFYKGIRIVLMKIHNSPYLPRPDGFFGFCYGWVFFLN